MLVLVRNPLLLDPPRDKLLLFSGNYRPISILPTIVKIFEEEVHKQLYSYLIDNNLLHPYQHGFRQKRSTDIALIGVIGKWLQSMDNGFVTAAVFVDLTKAFDTMKHSLLIKKLKALGSQA